MNPDYFRGNSNPMQNQMPETLADFILLLTAAKEKYGNLKVRYVPDSNYINNSDEYLEFDDFVIAGGVESLVRSNQSSDNERYFLFVNE
jgi:hypothetical protein